MATDDVLVDALVADDFYCTECASVPNSPVVGQHGLSAIAAFVLAVLTLPYGKPCP